MIINGRTVSLTTGTDVERMKRRLFNEYFHIPEPVLKKPRRRR